MIIVNVVNGIRYINSTKVYWENVNVYKSDSF